MGNIFSIVKIEAPHAARGEIGVAVMSGGKGRRGLLSSGKVGKDMKEEIF